MRTPTARTPSPGTGPVRPEPRLVGRDEERDVLNEQARLALSSGFRMALVTGAAGLGKTRLVADAAGAHESQAVVLSARAYRWGVTASLGIWGEALDRHLHSLDEDEQRDLCGPFLAELTGFLTVAQGLASDVEREPSREGMLDALVGLLERMGRRGPVLVVLDDVHLADNSSWEALRVLGRRLTELPIGVFTTARPADLRQQPTASEVIVGMDEDGLLRRVPLKPLTRAEIAELAHDVLRSHPGDQSSFVAEPLVAWLSERSLGHPLFVVNLLRALVEEGADLLAPRLERVPESLRDRVSLDLHTLDPADREVLEALAVTDRRTEVGMLQAVAGVPVGDLAASLERLTQHRLVAEHGVGTDLRYEITHPILQDVIYQDIAGIRRRVLHRAVAQAMVETGRLGSAAAHFARSGITGDDAAVDTLFRAMEQAQARDLYQEALAILDALLDVLPRGDDRWLRLVETLTVESDWVLSHLVENDADTAIAAMERALEVVRDSDDHVAEATVQLHLAAFLSLCAARYEYAEQACRIAIDRFEAAGEHDGALIARNELAWIRGGAGDLSTHVDIAADVFETASSPGRTGPALQAAGTAAYALGLRGEFERSGDLFRVAAELAEEADNRYRNAWARAQHGLILGLEGRLDEGIGSVEEALRIDAAAPDACALEDLAHCLWLAGRFAEGVAALERSAVRRPVHGSRRRAWGSALAARMYAEMGQEGRARSSLRRAVDTYAGGETLAWSCWPDWTAGFLAWQGDDPAAGLEALERSVERLERMGARAYEAVILADVAEIAAAADDRRRCERAANRLADLAAVLEGTLPPTLSRLGSAWAHLVGGDREAAAHDAADAADGLRRGGFEPLAATALVVRGRAVAGDDRTLALDLLRRAADAFDRCGATWRRDRTLAELRLFGSRGRRAAAEVRGPGALTAREHEVAELAAAGYTAREIGERLFVGSRTVETHLASIYAKLGIRSKRELVKRAGELPR